ncbi:MAG TPA: hypothetical protein VF468_12355 [Actinomycetota bacterium]|nr:hypothetical protein [Actinomycetota bacterium]
MAGVAGPAPQPWAEPGWAAQAGAWLAAEMERLGRPVTGPLREVRSWELACVLQAPTTAGDVYLKANAPSPAFVNEGVVMATLARLFGDLVPAPLAVEAERGWLVLDDFGEELGWDVPAEVVEEVARTFARLQVKATAHVGLLLAAGVHDRRLGRLAAEAAAWLPALGATAAGSPGSTGPPGCRRTRWPRWRPPCPHQAVSYRSMAAGLRSPVDPDLAQSTAWWLRRVLAGLDVGGA